MMMMTITTNGEMYKVERTLDLLAVLCIEKTEFIEIETTRFLPSPLYVQQTP